MKIFLALALALVCLLAGCANEDDVLHSGVNAVVVSIDIQNECIVANKSEDGAVLDIDCRGTELIYCDFETLETWEISVAELRAGDDIALVIRESELEKENGAVKPEQIQLITQR